MRRNPRVTIDVLTVEYRRRLFSRAYLISSLIGAIAVICLAIVPNLAPALTKIAHTTPTRIPISLTGPLEIDRAAARLLLPDEQLRVVAERLHEPASTHLNTTATGPDTPQADLEFRVTAHHLFVTISSDDPIATWKPRLRPLLPLAASISTGTPVAIENRIIRLPYRVIPSDARASHDNRLRLMEEAIATTLAGVLYGSIMIGSQMLLGAVSEEKTSKIAEMLAAMANPRDILLGKIAAACALALTQGTLWLLCGIVAYVATAHALTTTAAPSPYPFTENELLWPTLRVIAAFLTLAPLIYLQFACIYAGAAALISRPEDVSTIASPLAIPLGASAATGFYAANHAQTAVTTILSFTPLTAPFAMTARVADNAAPLSDILLSLLIQLACTALALEAASRLYRVGLTLYGSLPSLSQIYRMLKVA